MRIPSISADPDRTRRRAGERRRDRRPPARARPRVGAARGRRGFASVRDRRVDARRPRRADRPALCTSRRAAAGHRRELGRAIRSSRPNATAGSTAAAAPTTRPAASRTRTRSSAWLTTQRRAAVQRPGPDRRRRGDRIADAAGLPRRARRRAAQRRARARRRRQLEGRRARPHLFTARPRRGRHRAARARRPGALGHGRRRDPRSGRWRWPGCSPSLVDEHGDVAIDGLWDDVRPPTDAERGADRRLRRRSRAASRRAMGVRPGVQLVGDPGAHAARTAVAPAVAHGDRDRRAIRSRDRRIRSSPARPARAQPAARARPGTRPRARAAARARRAARAVGTRAALHRARRRARVADRSRPVPRSTRRGARCAPASAPSRC